MLPVLLDGSKTMNPNDPDFLGYGKCQVLHALCNAALDEAEQVEVTRRDGSFPLVEDLILDLEMFLWPVGGGAWARSRFTVHQLEAVTDLMAQIDEMYPRDRGNPEYLGSVEDLRLPGWDRVRSVVDVRVRMGPGHS